MSESPSHIRKRVNIGVSFTKIIILITVTAICLKAVMILFELSSVEQLPEPLRPYSSWILYASPYLRYFNSVIILVLGYLIIGELGKVIYTYVRGFADHSSAATVEKIARIVGFGVLFSILASVLSVDSAAALTFGSFSGLIFGFATQTFLSNTIAGVFVLVTRPFTFGDVVTISGKIGIVKELRLMYLVLESLDHSQEILIPNNLVLKQIIQKEIPGNKMGPIPTSLTLDQPPKQNKIGTMILLTGRLFEIESGLPLANSTVKLCDSDIGKDDILRTGVTDAEGQVTIDWTVKKVDYFDDYAEIFLRFDGDEEHNASKSKKYVINIK